jgi:hypothetical protein
MDKPMAFGYFGAKPHDVRTSVSAFADDGCFVVCIRHECWNAALRSQRLGKPLAVRQKLTEWVAGETGRTELRQHLERAHREGSIVRTVEACVSNPHTPDCAADSPSVYNYHPVEPFVLGTVTRLAGDDVELTIEKVHGGNTSYREAFGAFDATPAHSRKSPCAWTDNGQLVLCLWDHWLSGTPDSSTYKFSGAPRAWFAAEGADEVLRQTLRTAFETGSTVRLVTAHSWAPPDSGRHRTVQGIEVVRRFEAWPTYAGRVTAMRDGHVDIVFTRMEGSS